METQTAIPTIVSWLSTKNTNAGRPPQTREVSVGPKCSTTKRLERTRSKDSCRKENRDAIRSVSPTNAERRQLSNGKEYTGNSLQRTFSCVRVLDPLPISASAIPFLPMSLKKCRNQNDQLTDILYCLIFTNFQDHLSSSREISLHTNCQQIFSKFV